MDSLGPLKTRNHQDRTTQDLFLEGYFGLSHPTSPPWDPPSAVCGYLGLRCSPPRQFAQEYDAVSGTFIGASSSKSRCENVSAS